MTSREHAPDAARAALKRDGACCVRGALNSEQLATLARAVNAVQARPGRLAESLRLDEEDGPRYFNDLDRWRDVPEFERHAQDVAPLALALLQSSAAVFYHEHTLVKDAGALRSTPWHADETYYPVDGELLSLWAPLDRVTANGGPLRFAKGSHLLKCRFRPRLFATGLDYTPSSDANELEEYTSVPTDAELDGGETVSWECEPGDVVAFWGSTLHAASGNSSTSERRVVTTRWVTESAVLAPRPWTTSPPNMGGLAFGEKLCSSPAFPILARAPKT
mmetsp:Transcript_15184/g.49822  ORF Transcript_15184/g.49822 Transcript_15184/m.49822 type:complete len:277 (-) Transcript_15184:294-1124(-)